MAPSRETSDASSYVKVTPPPETVDGAQQQERPTKNQIAIVGLDVKVHRCPVSRGRLFFPIFCFNFRLVPIVYICCDFLYCTLRHMFFLHKFTSFISEKN